MIIASSTLLAHSRSTAPMTTINLTSARAKPPRRHPHAPAGAVRIFAAPGPQDRLQPVMLELIFHDNTMSRRNLVGKPSSQCGSPEAARHSGVRHHVLVNLLPPRPKSAWEFALNFLGLAIAGFLLPNGVSLTRELGYPLWPIVLLGLISVVLAVWNVVMVVGFIRDRQASRKAG
jgi:hypothetical protein